MIKMNRVVAIIAFHLIIFTLFSTGKTQDFGRSLDPKLYGFNKQKLSHFHFYLHDIYSAPNPTVIPVVKSPFNSTIGFGFISMMDDPLAQTPQMSSKLLGKCQGLYGSASQEEAALLMVMNFAFVEGKYNGSTLSILGRNKPLSKVREMPVIGGTGHFRFARGYVLATTLSFNQTTGDAVVEYNNYVLHY